MPLFHLFLYRNLWSKYKFNILWRVFQDKVYFVLVESCIPLSLYTGINNFSFTMFSSHNIYYVTGNILYKPKDEHNWNDIFAYHLNSISGGLKGCMTPQHIVHSSQAFVTSLDYITVVDCEIPNNLGFNIYIYIYQSLSHGQPIRMICLGISTCSGIYTKWRIKSILEFTSVLTLFFRKHSWSGEAFRGAGWAVSVLLSIAHINT